MQKWVPCLKCNNLDAQKAYWPFCSQSCAAKYGLEKVGKVFYCDKGCGWMYFSSSNPNAKARCFADHKKKV